MKFKVGDKVKYDGVNAVVREVWPREQGEDDYLIDTEDGPLVCTYSELEEGDDL